MLFAPVIACPRICLRQVKKDLRTSVFVPYKNGQLEMTEASSYRGTVTYILVKPLVMWLLHPSHGCFHLSFCEGRDQPTCVSILTQHRIVIKETHDG